MGWSNNADMVGFVGNVPLVISLFGLEMEIQKTVRDLDIKKTGGIDPLGSYRVLRRRVGAKGTQNFAPFRWRKMASNQNLKMVTIDFEIGG